MFETLCNSERLFNDSTKTKITSISEKSYNRNKSFAERGRENRKDNELDSEKEIEIDRDR